MSYLVRLLCIALALLVFSGTASAGNIRKVSYSWTSDGSGNATVTASFAGIILRVVTNPGVTAPTDDYDVTLVDPDGADLFVGRGANRDTATTEHFCPGVAFSDGTTASIMPVAFVGNATLTIANAGAAKEGTVVIYYSVSDFLP